MDLHSALVVNEDGTIHVFIDEEHWEEDATALISNLLVDLVDAGLVVIRFLPGPDGGRNLYAVWRLWEGSPLPPTQDGL